MNDEPTRLEQLGMLISFAVAVLMTGEMPESHLPKPGEITPLAIEFRGFYDVHSHRDANLLWTSLLPFVEDASYWGTARHLERLLRELPLMPSAIRFATAEYMAECDGDGWTADRELAKLKDRPRLHREYRGISNEISRRTGCPAPAVGLAWEKADELDEAWHALRAKLQELTARRRAQ